MRPGDLVDMWVIDAPLGAGGMGSVYRCHSQSSTRIRAAVKVLAGRISESPQGRQRFVREAEILHGLDHHNVVRVMSVRLEWDPPYLAMELVDGVSLDERISRGAIPLDEAVPMMRQMAAALAYVHGRGVRHRDVKPANLIVQPDGTVKLVDFGVALDLDATRMTSDSARIGTPAYAPPEWLGSDPVDAAAADLYALGVVFYEMLTGRDAFFATHGTSRQEVLRLMLHKQAVGALDPGDAFPHHVRVVVSALTSLDPRRRPAAERVIGILDEKQADGILVELRERVANTVEIPAEEEKRKKRSLVVPLAIAAALLALAVLGVAAVGLAAVWSLSADPEVVDLPVPAPLPAPDPVVAPDPVIAPEPVVVAPEPPPVVAPVVPKPPPVAPMVPKPPTGPPGRVSAKAFGAWLEAHPEWQRDAAIADRRADDGYLVEFAPTSGGPAKGTSWMAAAAYCESRGGLLPVDAEPASWGADEPFIEWRLGANGAPAWRNSIGDRSRAVTARQSNPDAAFRCGRP